MERNQTHLSQSPPQPGGFMYCLQRGATASHMAVGAQEEVIHKPNRMGARQLLLRQDPG